MSSGDNVKSFTRGVATMSNNTFLQLFPNVLLIAVAANNIEYPSVKFPQSYDNSQRVFVGGKFLDLQTAVMHNVKKF